MTLVRSLASCRPSRRRLLRVKERCSWRALPPEKRSALHQALHLLQDRRQFCLRLRRTLAVERLQAELDHLLLEFLAELGRSIGAGAQTGLLGGVVPDGIARLAHFAQGIGDGPPAFVLG